jgi:cellulose synthase/poly-beta-1,6-N-acetylglucosamine synthase-like glycosyltransferase
MDKLLFWVCLAAVSYCYLGYPLILWLWRFARGRGTQVSSTMLPPRRFQGKVSIVIAARNESQRIGARVREFAEALTSSCLAGEIIVVSDGSTDRTVAAVKEIGEPRARVIELDQHAGKAVALTRGASAATGDVIVFADCRQTWAPDALQSLVLRLASDSSIGAVSGDLVLQREAGMVGTGVGLYWRFEKWLRCAESDLFSTVGVSGSISAVRRALLEPIPAGTILDDVYWPLRVVMGGHRVVHEPRAFAYDRLPGRAGDEFCRKVRTLAGNFQLLARLPSAVFPWRNPIWLQFLSHKVLRLAVPWALIAMLVGSFSARQEWLYGAAMWSQLAAYSIALAGASRTLSARFRPAAAASSFVLLNAAAWVAFWVWISGRSSRSWAKVSYQTVGAPTK